KRDACTVALHNGYIGCPSEICGEPLGQFRIEFDRRYPTAATDQSVQYRSVIAYSCTDMHGMLARLRRGTCDQPSVQRRLPVVEMAFRNDADDHVIIKIDGVSTGRRHIAAPPAQDLPGAASEKILALDRSKGVLDAPVEYTEGCHDPLGISAPDYFLL